MLRLAGALLAVLAAAFPAEAKDLPEFMIFTYGIQLTETNLKALTGAGFNTVGARHLQESYRRPHFGERS